jgi:uncharacterized protein YqeY
MSDPQQRVEVDLRAAMKAGDKERLGTLRMLLAEIKNERIRRGGEVDDAGLAALVRRAVKQRHESAEQYRKGGREESAAREEREAVILGEYLPEQAGEDEVRAAVERLVDERGLSGPAAIGPVMKEMLARFGSRADGATINRVARQVLEERAGA